MLSTAAGYTICFLKNGRVKQFTIATSDDLAIERRLRNYFGDIEIIGRMPLDQNALELLRLKRDNWIEWEPLRALDERDVTADISDGAG